jgi:hypothetical protein
MDSDMVGLCKDAGLVRSEFLVFQEEWKIQFHVELWDLFFLSPSFSSFLLLFLPFLLPSLPSFLPFSLPSFLPPSLPPFLPSSLPSLFYLAVLGLKELRTSRLLGRCSTT